MINSRRAVLCVTFALSINALFVATQCGCRSRTLTLADYFKDTEVRRLAEATASGRLDEAARLVELGVNVNSLGRSRMTPLAWCFLSRSESGFEFLLQKGADPNIQQEDGSSVIFLAASETDAEWLELVLVHGGNPNLVDTVNQYAPKRTPIFDAIRSHCPDNVKLLIRSGANVNHINGRGYTPLLAAEQFGWYDIVYLLLDAGADYRIKHEAGFGVVDRIAMRSQQPIPRDGQEDWRARIHNFFSAEGIDIDELHDDAWARSRNGWPEPAKR